jgi:hypothetical protein
MKTRLTNFDLLGSYGIRTTSAMDAKNLLWFREWKNCCLTTGGKESCRCHQHRVIINIEGRAKDAVGAWKWIEIQTAMGLKRCQYLYGSIHSWDSHVMDSTVSSFRRGLVCVTSDLEQCHCLPGFTFNSTIRIFTRCILRQAFRHWNIEAT